VDFLHRQFYHNSIQVWLTAGAIGATLFLVLLVARRLLISRSHALHARFDDAAHEYVAALFAATRRLILLYIALHLATRSLDLPDRLDNVLIKAGKLVVLLQVALWGSAAIAVWARRQRRITEDQRAGIAMIGALAIGARVVLWILIGIGVLGAFDINVFGLLTGLGVAGVAVALAVQNILGDLLAALAIVFDKPFDVGDTIGVDQVSGTVEHIGLKTTRIRSITGEQVIIGNADLLKSRLRNYKRMTQRRMVFTIDMPYQTSAAQVARVPGMLKEIVSAQSPTRFDRSHVATLGESAVRAETVYYVLDPDYTKAMDVQHAINVGVLQRFASEGIAFSVKDSPQAVTVRS